jgi:hypothetical protein
MDNLTIKDMLSPQELDNIMNDVEGDVELHRIDKAAKPMLETALLISVMALFLMAAILFQ